MRMSIGLAFASTLDRYVLGESSVSCLTAMRGGSRRPSLRTRMVLGAPERQEPPDRAQGAGGARARPAHVLAIRRAGRRRLTDASSLVLGLQYANKPECLGAVSDKLSANAVSGTTSCQRLSPSDGDARWEPAVSQSAGASGAALGAGAVWHRARAAHRLGWVRAGRVPRNRSHRCGCVEGTDSRRRRVEHGTDEGVARGAHGNRPAIVAV
jgi:hypothetical protein